MANYCLAKLTRFQIKTKIKKSCGLFHFLPGIERDSDFFRVKILVLYMNEIDFITLLFQEKELYEQDKR